MSFFCLMQEFYKYFFKGELKISVRERRKVFMMSYIGVLKGRIDFCVSCYKLCKVELVIFGLSYGDKLTRMKGNVNKRHLPVIT